MDYWAQIRTQRLRTADFFESLSDGQWHTQSLCDAWTVHDVAAHLVMPLVTPTWKFALAMLRAKGNFDRASEDMTAHVAQASSHSLVGQLRENAASHFKPPGMGPRAPLTDIIIHGQDAALPLGQRVAVDNSMLVESLEFVTSSEARRGFIPGRRVDGLQFKATDVNWTHGDGPLVAGAGIDLLLAIAGRAVALTNLHGDGTSQLAQRIF